MLPAIRHVRTGWYSYKTVHAHCTRSIVNRDSLIVHPTVLRSLNIQARGLYGSFAGCGVGQGIGPCGGPPGLVSAP